MKFWWKRGRRPSPADTPDDADNILIISDIHLGEDILVEGPPQLSEYIRVLNLKLTQFIQAHTVDVKERRWHLVINGDMFDFVKVAGAGDAPVVKPLSNTPENVVLKLRHILEVHRPLFRAIAHFLRAGHRVSIIEGNHDAEFFFDDVRNALREELVRLALQNIDKKMGSPREIEAGVRERIVFRSWFLASLGRFHIEHGHQYDEFCSFEYPLAPLDAGPGGTLATPMSHRPLPHFAEMLGDFSTHGISHWSFRDMLAFLKQLGARAFITLFRMYLGVGFGLLRLAGGKRRTQMQDLASQHELQLLALSQSSPYGLRTLRQLDALKALPAEYKVWKMAHVFYLDRIALGFWGSVAAVLFLAFGHGLWAAQDFVVTVLSIALLSKVGKHDAQPLLRASADRIASITGARYVVFGHSHAPELCELASGHYINSGSWVTREVLRGASGRGMTYVEINAEGGRLLRWRGPGEAPEVLASPGVIK